MLRDIAIAISLANLCLMKVWNDVNYTYSVDKQYHSQLIPNMNYYFAAILNIFILASIFFFALILARKSKKPTVIKVAKVAFILTITIPVFIITSTISKTLSIVFIITLLILLLRMHFYFRRDITDILTKGVLILFSFFLFNLSVTAFKIIRIDPLNFKDKPRAEAITVKEQTNRIIWIIFDEMDQRLTFEDRSFTIKLPEIDRLKSQALYASNAYPPAGETDLSLPSLITGKMVSKYEAFCPNELMLTLSENNQVVEWNAIPNIFSKAYSMGVNTALYGWYHPYGRVIGSSLTSCSSKSVELTEITFSEAIALQFELFIKSIPITEYCDFLDQFYVLDRLKQKYFIKSYLEILDESKRAVVNNDFGLILVHLPVPHPPGFYDRVKKEFSLNECSYLDNIALADRTLGELRHAMENSDTWDTSTVIITSDHWLRKDIWDQKKLWVNEKNELSFYKGNDHRVPFMLKLAGQKEGIYYTQTFNTIITHDLILALLRNEISSPDEVIKWIEDKRTDWSIPDYSNSSAKYK